MPIQISKFDCQMDQYHIPEQPAKVAVLVPEKFTENVKDFESFADIAYAMVLYETLKLTKTNTQFQAFTLEDLRINIGSMFFNNFYFQYRNYLISNINGKEIKNQFIKYLNFPINSKSPLDSAIQSLHDYISLDDQTSKAVIFILDHGCKGFIGSDETNNIANLLKSVCSGSCKDFLFFVDTCSSGFFSLYIKLIYHLRKSKIPLDNFLFYCTSVCSQSDESINLIKDLFNKMDLDTILKELEKQGASPLSNRMDDGIEELRKLFPLETNFREVLPGYVSFLSSFDISDIDFLRDTNSNNNNLASLLRIYNPPPDVNIAVIASTAEDKPASFYPSINLDRVTSITLGSYGVSEYTSAILTFKGTVLDLFDHIKTEIMHSSTLYNRTLVQVPMYAATSDEILNRDIREFFPPKDEYDIIPTYSDEVLEISRIYNEITRINDALPTEREFLNLMEKIGFMYLKIPEDAYKHRSKEQEIIPSRESVDDLIDIDINLEEEITDERFKPKHGGINDFDFDKCVGNLDDYYNDGKEVVCEFFALFNQELLKLNPNAVKFIPFYTINGDLYQTEEDNYHKFIETYRKIDTNLFYLPFFKKTRYSFSYYLSQNLKSGEDYYSLLRPAFDRLMRRHKEEEFKRSTRQ